MQKQTQTELLMNKQQIDAGLNSLSESIYNEYKDCLHDVVLVGIRRRGVTLSYRMRDKLYLLTGVRVMVGILDITLYRDDLTMIAQQPIVKPTQIPFDITNKVVILVDDVLYTGRTVRAAIDALIDFGRPRSIKLAVLIDRGCRELPIQADYFVKKIETSPQQIVQVYLLEEDGKEDSVLLLR